MQRKYWARVRSGGQDFYLYGAGPGAAAEHGHADVIDVSSDRLHMLGTITELLGPKTVLVVAFDGERQVAAQAEHVTWHPMQIEQLLGRMKRCPMDRGKVTATLRLEFPGVQVEDVGSGYALTVNTAGGRSTRYLTGRSSQTGRIYARSGFGDELGDTAGYQNVVEAAEAATGLRAFSRGPVYATGVLANGLRDQHGDEFSVRALNMIGSVAAIGQVLDTGKEGFGDERGVCGLELRRRFYHRGDGERVGVTVCLALTTREAVEALRFGRLSAAVAGRVDASSALPDGGRSLDVGQDVHVMLTTQPIGFQGPLREMTAAELKALEEEGVAVPGGRKRSEVFEELERRLDQVVVGEKFNVALKTLTAIVLEAGGPRELEPFADFLCRLAGRLRGSSANQLDVSRLFELARALTARPMKVDVQGQVPPPAEAPAAAPAEVVYTRSGDEKQLFPAEIHGGHPWQATLANLEPRILETLARTAAAQLDVPVADVMLVAREFPSHVRVLVKGADPTKGPSHRLRVDWTSGSCLTLEG